MADDNVISMLQEHLKRNFPNIDAKRPLNEPTPIVPIGFTLRDPRSIPRRQFLHGRHYVRKFVSATIAPGGLGKSSLVLCDAIAMASGKRILRDKPKTPFKVWYWNGEDPYDELERRIAGICLHYGITNDDLGNRLYVDSGREGPIRVAEETSNGAVIVQPVFDEMVAQVKELGIDCIMFDPFVACHAVSENDNSIINEVVKGFATVADQCDVSIDLTHHVRKAREGFETQAEDARGASALIDGCRSVRTLTRMTKDQAEQYGIDDTDRKSHFYVALGKANLGPPEDPQWHFLQGVGIGNDTPEGPEDYVGVVTVWDPPSAFEGVENNDVQRVQAHLGDAAFRADARSPEYVGRAIASALNLNFSADGVSARIRAMIKAWLKSGLLEEFSGKDERRETRTFIRVGRTISEVEEDAFASSF